MKRGGFGPNGPGPTRREEVGLRLERGRRRAIRQVQDGGGRANRIGQGHQRATILNLPDGNRKSTRLNSSHQIISYAVICLKKKQPNPSTVAYTNNVST